MPERQQALRALVALRLLTRPTRRGLIGQSAASPLIRNIVGNLSASVAVPELVKSTQVFRYSDYFRRIWNRLASVE